MFANRKEGGQLLSGLLASRGYARPIVLALSSGGVPVGYEIARALGASLELLSLAVPGTDARARRWGPELSRRALDLALESTGRGARFPAIGERGAQGASERRCSCLDRVEGPPLEITGRTVILVDDSLECGGPLAAALPHLRRRAPRRIVLATPVAALDACAELERQCDEVFCLSRPASGVSPAHCYSVLEPITDASVIELLERAALPGGGS